jgi:hypothetical protein
VVLLLAAACAPSGGTTRAEAKPVPVPQTEPSPREQTTSALDKPDAEGLPAPLVNPRDIVSGGPPPDGIPALDHPKFVRASGVTSLKDREPVLAVQIGDDARAYPIEIMTWHEIANDTVADVPVAVSYCPLCNSAIAYDRRLDQRILDFGTSGKLYQSALVMYDRQTESLWSHFTAQAVAGVLTGAAAHDPRRHRELGRLAPRPPTRARAQPRHRIRPPLRPEPIPGVRRREHASVPVQR